MAAHQEEQIRTGRNSYARAQQEEEEEVDTRAHFYSLFPELLLEDKQGLGPAGAYYHSFLMALEAPPFNIAQHHSNILLASLVALETYQLEWGLQPLLFFVGDQSAGKSHILDVLRLLLIPDTSYEQDQQSAKAKFTEGMRHGSVLMRDELHEDTKYYITPDNKFGDETAKKQLSTGSLTMSRTVPSTSGFVEKRIWTDHRQAELVCANRPNLGVAIRDRGIRKFVPIPDRYGHGISAKRTRGKVAHMAGDAEQGSLGTVQDLFRKRQHFHAIVSGLYAVGGLVQEDGLADVVEDCFRKEMLKLLGTKREPQSFNGRTSEKVRRLAQVIAVDRAWVMLCCGVGEAWGIQAGTPYDPLMWERDVELASLLAVREEDVLTAISFLAEEFYEPGGEVMNEVLVERVKQGPPVKKRKTRLEWVKRQNKQTKKWVKVQAEMPVEEGDMDAFMVDTEKPWVAQCAKPKEEEARDHIFSALASYARTKDRKVDAFRYKQHLWALLTEDVLRLDRELVQMKKGADEEEAYVLYADPTWYKTQCEGRAHTDEEGVGPWVGGLVLEALRRAAQAQGRLEERRVGLFGMPLLDPVDPK